MTYTYGPLRWWLPKLVFAAFVSVGLVAAGLCSKRGRELRLPLVWLSLATLLVLGLGAILLTVLDHRKLLIFIHERVSDVELRWVPTCTGGLEACSLLVALDSAAMVAGVVIALASVVCLVPGRGRPGAPVCAVFVCARPGTTKMTSPTTGCR